jgi:hypothetical protein
MTPLACCGKSCASEDGTGCIMKVRAPVPLIDRTLGEATDAQEDP